MVKTFQNIARSEILETDRQSVSKRSTKSMFEESSYLEQRNGALAGLSGDDGINAKVRKAIENSFIKQMEENAALDNTSDMRENKEQSLPSHMEDTKELKEEEVSQNCQQNRARKPSNATGTKKELPDMITELPNGKNTAKRIMDAVIREMVDAKVLEQHGRSDLVMEYEVDSLERSKCSRKSSTSPESTDQSSLALSTALPMDEELTMQNAVITKSGEMMRLNKEVLERNYYNSLPELVSSQRPESYSLVSEVYVNDGYDSPACSDDSGPEIQYEPENPGHLTIKVQDSPENYVKQDESEYEPDTLDRKPMKLKINDDVNYEREVPDEVYVDSLERPAQILLKSNGSFRDQDSTRNSSQRGYGTLREIYEARLKNSIRNFALNGSNRSLNGRLEDTMSWKKCKYLTPETKQAKRQRQPSNQPDVVPMPPTEEIYQHPKPPRRVKDIKPSPNSSLSKNGWDRSPAEADDPTTSNGAPVPSDLNVGTTDPCSCNPRVEESVSRCKYQLQNCSRSNLSRKSKTPPSWNSSQGDKKKASGHCHSHTADSKCRNPQRRHEEPFCSRKHSSRLSRSCESMSNSANRLVGSQQPRTKVEDSGYLSSTDSNGSHKRLLKHEVSSVSETDETESICDGASESGAESVGTDSVFFGNFRRLSEFTSFPKSMDSGVEVGVRSMYLQPYGVRNEIGERTNFSTSDSETESFITVLPPCGAVKDSV